MDHDGDIRAPALALLSIDHAFVNRSVKPRLRFVPFLIGPAGIVNTSTRISEHPYSLQCFRRYSD